MAHWLNPLLNPASIAIVGASEREASLAAITHRQLVSSGYPGVIFSVNPRYRNLHGGRCYPTLSELPGVPDLVLFAISGRALEDSFSEALALKVGGIVIYASNYLADDTVPSLIIRLRQRASAAGIPVCGGNSMGFYNYDSNVMLSFDSPPPGRPGGHISLILHSGSGMTYLANNDMRFRFNYVIASAQEINASVGDYMDYLLDQPSTRVIAIFLETVRDVPAFTAALEKARCRSIPVVITRLGRTEQSAQLAMSHSGAIVGDHEAFVAICRRYGVILCRDADELIVTAMLFAAGFRTGRGGLASMLDSGGMREQMIDLAEDYALPFARLSDATTSILRQHLESGLDATNPMDGMGALGSDIHRTYLECGKAMLDDSNTALLSFEFEFRDGFSHYPELFEVTRQLADYNDKPVILVNSSSYSNISHTAAELSAQGIPVINGIDLALRAMRNLLDFHPPAIDSGSQPNHDLDQATVDSWFSRLQDHGVACDEASSLQLMSDFGLPVIAFTPATNRVEVREAAESYGYPVVLKTAAPGIAHKSDRDGVIVGIEGPEQLEACYADLQARLGNPVLVMPRVEAGVEVSVGMKNDPQYGPLVIVACGGVLIELLAERAFALAPLNRARVNAMIDEIRLARLLNGLRGQAAVDRDSLVDLVVRFSQVVMALSETVLEIDLNPVIVNQSGCCIVDALVIPCLNQDHG